MRPPIRTTCWLCIVASLPLAVSALTLSTRSPQTPSVHAYATFLSRNLALVSDSSRLALKPATPSRTSVYADNSELDEEEEYESSCSFFHLVCPAFISTDSPSNLLSRPSPGSSPPPTVAVPLRC